jgi:hypothetical protein
MSSSEDDDVSIVNREFSEKADIGCLVDGEPETFVFENLNGVSAEATVIAWQIQSALGFATSQEYVGADDTQEWLMVLTKTLAQFRARDGFWLCKWCLRVFKRAS